MKLQFAAAAFLALAANPVAAADPSPIGDWLVKDGYAHIRIDNCSGKLWGIVAWEKTPGGTDKENPDASKRSRPTLGMPIILGFAPTQGNKWEGEIYNSQNGKLYSASVSMADEDTLELQGCLFPNFLCQTQTWTRVKSAPPNALPLPPVKGASAPAKSGAKKGAASAPPSDVCLRIADTAAAQQRANAKK